MAHGGPHDHEHEHGVDDHADPSVEGLSAEQRSAMRLLALDRATAHVMTSLTADGVRSILLKGPALTRWLYREDEWRSYVDCDLLVSPEDVRRAEQTLERLGFQREGLHSIRHDWDRYADSWRGPTAAVDLHHSMIGIGVSPTEFWRVMSGSTESMVVGGADVEVLGPGCRAFAVVIHVAKDGSRRSKARHDLGHAVTRLPLETWREALQVADQLDAREAFAAGLRMEPTGRELAARLGLPEVTPPVDVAIRRHGGAPPLAAGVNWMITTPGVGNKLRVIGRKLVPPPAFMRSWKPIARKGTIGLAIAYVWRPFWVLWHVVPAVRSVLRARRAARHDRSRTRATPSDHDRST
jgi:hypothetical protein